MSEMSSLSKRFWDDYYPDEKAIEVMYVKELESRVEELESELDVAHWEGDEVRNAVKSFLKDIDESQ